MNMHQGNVCADNEVDVEQSWTLGSVIFDVPWVAFMTHMKVLSLVSKTDYDLRAQLSN